jgi:hypothetical protein
MIITENSQERLLHNYSSNGRTIDECCAFVEGMQATIRMVDKMMREEKTRNNKLKNKRNAKKSS